MERKNVEPPAPPSAPTPFIDKNINSNTAGSDDKSSRLPRSLGSARSKRSQKRKEETWDDDSLQALRGYAALSRDEITGAEVDWRHLNQSNEQEMEAFPADSESEMSSDAGNSVSSRFTTNNARGTHVIYMDDTSVSASSSCCGVSLTKLCNLLEDDLTVVIE